MYFVMVKGLQELSFKAQENSYDEISMLCIYFLIFPVGIQKYVFNIQVFNSNFE